MPSCSRFSFIISIISGDGSSAVTVLACRAIGTAHPPVPAPMSMIVDPGSAFSIDRMKSRWTSGVAHRFRTPSLKDRALSFQ